VIVLDTHIWIWWVHGHSKLSNSHAKLIQDSEGDAIGVCAISCWEVSKLVQKRRLELPLPVEDWMRLALDYPAFELIPLEPRIAIESTQLPARFHDDPADQIIVATARLLDCPLITADEHMIQYPTSTLRLERCALRRGIQA